MSLKGVEAGEFVKWVDGLRSKCNGIGMLAAKGLGEFIFGLYFGHKYAGFSVCCPQGSGRSDCVAIRLSGKRSAAVPLPTGVRPGAWVLQSG